MFDFKKDIAAYIETEKETIERLDADALNDAYNAILATRNRSATIYTLGNGGSAATASHMVNDLAKGASQELRGQKFKCECLCDNTPTITAIANDICYEDIFVQQLEGKLTADDLLVCISGSGNSENVIRAAEYAKGIGTEVLALTGFDGGRLKTLADHSVHVPIDDMQIVEDLHMMFDHMMLCVLSTCKGYQTDE